MRLNSNRIRAAFGAAVLMLGVLGTRVTAEIHREDFFLEAGREPRGSLGATTRLLPPATVVRTNGQTYLSLTEAVRSQRGTWVLNNVAGNQRVARLVAEFEVNINQPGANRTTSFGDGLSFNFGPNLVDLQISEDGAPRGLSITIDTFDNGGTDTAPAIEVVYDGIARAGVLFDGVTRSTGNHRNLVGWVNSNPFTFINTGTSFIPMRVTLEHEESSGSSFVSVDWRGQRILSRIPVPYTPVAEWQIAFAARTGDLTETHYLRNVVIETDRKVQLTVTSEYGAGLPELDPPVGSRLIDANRSVPVRAPRHVYLDRFKRHLGADEAASRDPRARYRATFKSSSLSSGPGPDVVGEIRAQGDVTLNWNWELENLAEINTGTDGIVGLAPTDVTDPVHVAQLGRHYRTLGDTGFDSVVRRSIGGADLPVRFAARGFVVENVPSSADRFLELSGNGDHLRGTRPFTNRLTAADGSFTAEFWTRLNPGTASRQTVFAIGRTRSPSLELRAGFESDRAFFVTDGSRTVSAPAALTDSTWHHWAVVNDRAANQVRILRDGRVFVSQAPAFGILNTDGVVSIGAAPDGENGIEPFSGGINSLRVWPAALSVDQVLVSRSSASPVQNPAFQFDADAQAPAPVLGASIEQRVLGPNLPVRTADDIPSWTLDRSRPQSNTNGLVLPTIAAVPLRAATAGRIGWIGRTLLNIPSSGTYRFFLTSSGGARLLLDGQPVVANDSPSPGLAQDGTVTLSSGAHLLEVRMIDPQSSATAPQPERLLRIEYESGSILPRQALPLAALSIPARGLLLDGRVVLGTNGPNTLGFHPRGLENLVRPEVDLQGVRSTLLPGILTGFESSFGQTTATIPNEAKTPLDDWRRVFWLWERQFRMEVFVTSDDPGGITAVRRLPFLGGGVQVDGTTAGGSSVVGEDVVKAIDTWVGDGLPLIVGTVYRTPDRRLTLSSISGNLNLFGGVSMESVVDGVHGGAVTRQVGFEAVNAPGALTFNYSRTTHRVALPIGGFLDLSSVTNTTAPLLPDLPVGARDLRITTAGPLVDEVSVSTTDPDKGGEGVGHQWDVVARRWYPLRPGRFTLTWPDTNGYTHTLEVTANFPNEVQTLPNWERKDGSRHGNGIPHALEGFRFPAIGAPFPGAPGAHYTYAVSPNTTEPYPADLDPDNGDRWKFLRLAFSDQRTASMVNGRIFQEQQAGLRSVLVYSQRAAGAGTATGDLSRESILVRVLRSTDGVDTNGVATVGERLLSPRDLGGFRSGYVVHETSNYNPQAYQRRADPGQWGPLFPVNNAVVQGLAVGWYDNPSRFNDPPGALPTATVQYSRINWPNPATAPVIYLSSRLGSEGVGREIATQRPNYQEIFDPGQVSDLAVYHQPLRDQAGFNPNEEHAFVERSIAFQLTGDPRFDRNQQAVFALQNQINRTETNAPASYTSEPWVLVQFRVTDPVANPRGELSMRAYSVERTREGTGTVPFPAVNTDATSTFFQRPFDASGNPIPQPANPRYSYQYSAFAGNPVVPPHPVDRAIGNVSLTNSTGGNVLTGTPLARRRALWFDRNHQAWVVSGGGQFFQRFWYPLRQEFWFGEVSGNAPQRPVDGTPIAWAPIDAPAGQLSSFTNATALPAPAFYDTFWRADHPILKRGETLTFQGGESKADSPSRPGLPGLVGWSSSEVVFDSGVPSMAFDAISRSNVSVLLTRPLDRFRHPLPQGSMPGDLQPARPDKVMVSGGRWYFKELAASLGGRFYYDPLAGELVLRGRLNGKEGGAPDLTVPPIGPTILEANRLAPGEREALLALAPGNPGWQTAVTALLNQIPASPGFTNQAPVGTQPAFFRRNPNTGLLTLDTGGTAPTQFPLRSLGAGAALVPSAEFLSRPPEAQPRFVTLVENNDPLAGGAVALHVLRIGNERFRGSIAVIDPPNIFDEKIELQHSADFGGITGEVFYQWYVRDVGRLDSVGTPDAATSGWQLYQQGLGLSRITFAGRPDITLADKFFYVRYGGRQELQTIDARNRLTPPASVVDTSWRLVSPDALSPDWNSGGNSRIPYQWAGAANSPHLQADGSRRFLPQLVMGWVKRVLDEINPFEARFKATFAGDSPSPFSSMLQQAGRPYIGPVAFNADKDPIERVGLIELYETVLQRAKDLTRDTPSTGTDQAILLAATRLALLYDLLGAEAFSDAQSPSIPLTDSKGQPIESDASPYAARTHLFAFENQVPSLLQEELALLRGTDFLKSYPVFNRLFWNYTKGLGEAAYNINYHVQDATHNGVIDAEDAALLYPMGHGDAWGHHLSAIKMHYDLLRRTGFRWEARSEYYALLGNVVPTDYLDEKSFARSAARRAQTGIQVVRGTYRSAYVADPAGQWQGYADLSDPARAWGVTEWAGRVGHGALFDWVVANAITPPKDPTPSGNPVVDLDRIDRSINRVEIAAIGAAMTELDLALDAVNRGQNPLGFDDQAMAFDISGQSEKTPFEQVFQRAILAGHNADIALDYSTRIDQALRAISSETAELQRQAVLQDLDYRNRLIGLLGTPYEGTIGPGGLFKEGYTGPDLITFQYVDEADLNRITPRLPEEFKAIETRVKNLSTPAISDWVNIGGGPRIDRANISRYFEDFFITKKFPTTFAIGNTASDGKNTVLVTELPFETTRQYGMTAPPGWGRRRSPGAVQEAIQEMLAAEIEVEVALKTYQSYFKDLAKMTAVTEQRMRDLRVAAKHRGFFLGWSQFFSTTTPVLELLKDKLMDKIEPGISDIFDTAKEAPPTVVGLANDVFSGVRAAIAAKKSVVSAGWKAAAYIAAASKLTLEISELNAGLQNENGAAILDEFGAFSDAILELAGYLSAESDLRLAITGPLNRLNMAADRVLALQAEALRLQEERTAFNMQVAAMAQRNRYDDLAARMGRNEAVRQYDAALETALRYAFLALRAYDYETSLSEDHPASVRGLHEELMRTRQLGLWAGGQPQIGNGGLAEILAKVRDNHRALKTQIGLESPQVETGTFSLRSEYLRLPMSAFGDGAWRRQLAARKVADLWEVPEFAAYCRPFSRPEDGPQPGLVIEFPTTIELGKNLFGNTLQTGDRAFSTAEYATKIRSHAVAFPGYDRSILPIFFPSQLSSSPRVYLVPVGLDRQRTSDSRFPEVREWKVLSQRIPTPFVINPGQLAAAEPISGQRGVDGSFVDRVRFSDFRAFTESIGGPDGTDPWNDNEAAAATSSRLYGRSVWNTRWLLIIPGATLGANPDAALRRFVDSVKDIEVQFQTYSNPGM